MREMREMREMNGTTEFTEDTEDYLSCRFYELHNQARNIIETTHRHKSSVNTVNSAYAPKERSGIGVVLFLEKALLALLALCGFSHSAIRNPQSALRNPQSKKPFLPFWPFVVSHTLCFLTVRDR
jgi:hypothetical protein